jgi:hypothetical protein
MLKEYDYSLCIFVHKITHTYACTQFRVARARSVELYYSPPQMLHVETPP